MRTLSQATGIHLEHSADPGTLNSPLDDTIICTDVRSTEGDKTAYSLTWKGFISSSDCRDDGLLLFGAHLFPIVGGRRACIQRQHAAGYSYDLAFRYLMLTQEKGWEDRGWQLDDFEEFEHWYCD